MENYNYIFVILFVAVAFSVLGFILGSSFETEEIDYWKERGDICFKNYEESMRRCGLLFDDDINIPEWSDVNE